MVGAQILDLTGAANMVEQEVGGYAPNLGLIAVAIGVVSLGLRLVYLVVRDSRRLNARERHVRGRLAGIASSGGVPEGYVIHNGHATGRPTTQGRRVISMSSRYARLEKQMGPVRQYSGPAAGGRGSGRIAASVGTTSLGLGQVSRAASGGGRGVPPHRKIQAAHGRAHRGRRY